MKLFQCQKCGQLLHFVEAWLALTFAVNAINRSMGLHDLYPFVLGATAVAKLAFVARCIRAAAAVSSKFEGAIASAI